MTRPGKDNPNWRGGEVELQCQGCGNSYHVIQCRKSISKYCSRLCQNRKQAEKLRVVKVKKWKLKQFSKLVCSACGFAGVKKGRKLHEDCRPEPKHPLITRICTECGDSKLYRIKNGVLPNRCIACELKHRKKEENGRWIDGRTPENKIIRNSRRYSEWRKFVFTRDNYTCQHCGQYGHELHADHIKPFSGFPELRFDVSNGRTLCRSCHEKTPTYRRGMKAYLEAHKQEIL